MQRASIFTPARITVATNGTAFDRNLAVQPGQPLPRVSVTAFGFFLTATVLTLRIEHSSDNVTFVTHPQSPGGASGFAASAAGFLIDLDPATTLRYVRLAAITVTGTDVVAGGDILWSA